LEARPASARPLSCAASRTTTARRLGRCWEPLVNPSHLTPREQQVLELVAQGLRDADIAKRLFLSPKTVHHHVSTILRKMGVATRTQAAAQFR
jgi:DNA-binding NarL/FixJ family response regulator